MSWLPDSLFFIGIQLLIYFCVFRSDFFQRQDPRVVRTFPFIWFIHLCFNFFYTFYIMQEGGDALSYWRVEADLSQGATSWMGYFGFSTFFIQWLNYIPGKVWQLSFFTGNLIYGGFSLLGILLGMILTAKIFPTNPKSKILSYLPFLVWGFPGLHFWSAGVGKECLLLTAMLGLWYCFHENRNVVLLAVGSWLLIIMVRPFIGLLLLMPLVYLLWKKVDLSKVYRIGLFICLALSSLFAMHYVLRYSHIMEYSVSDIFELSRTQLQFLEGFGANTAIPMLEYPWWEKLLTVFYRPFIWEAWSWFSFVFSMENTLLLILSFIVPLAIWKGLFHINSEITVVFLLIISVFLIYSLTLNNFGLIYRMKSVWLPFLYISLLWLIWPFIAKTNV